MKTLDMAEPDDEVNQPSTCPVTPVVNGVARVRHLLAQGHVTTVFRGADCVSAGGPTHFSLSIEADFDLPAGACLALARRWPSDWGTPQWTRSGDPDFATAVTSGTARLQWRTVRRHTWHPFDHVLVLELLDTLAAGDSLGIEFGGMPGESPGYSVQTFIEESSPLSVRLLTAPGKDWVEIAKPSVCVCGGEPRRLVITTPGRVQADAALEVHVRAEDQWGNPAGLERPLALILEGEDGSTTALALPAEAWCSTQLVFRNPGPAVVSVRVEGNKDLAARSNPIDVVVGGDIEGLVVWGDLHAQSAIGCGVRAIDNYFRHARDFAATDFGSHQANCFLVSGQEWEETQRGTCMANEEGRFVTLLGVEWSGASRLGGDHNVFFPGDAAELRRCSHQFVRDKSDVDKDLPHVNDLYAHYRGTDTLMAVHVGGRTADLQFHEPGLERLLEVHSTHATSEWFLFEALRRGYRFGVVAGSDSVDGRPGASHPGRMAVRNVRGGLTAVQVPSLTRASLWKALKERRCYATTGKRIQLSLRAGQLRMGDEASVRISANAALPAFEVSVTGTDGIEAIDFFRDDQLLARLDPLEGAQTWTNRVRIGWRGASAPGNWERARMVWDGALRVDGSQILSAVPWAMDTPDEGITLNAADHVAWRSVTAGDWDGLVLTLDRPESALISFASDPLSAQCHVRTLGATGWVHERQSPWRMLEIKRIAVQEAPLRVRHTFSDPAPPVGSHAYWVRVRQTDGAYAWSTPIFFDIEREAQG